jgi:glycosyltransferase involved in cell wall biosynthesis
MKVAVVTPTIGNPKLADCLASVNNQTYKNLTHYIFIDGSQYEEQVKKIIIKSPKVWQKTIKLEENVGKGWYGHRVFAACSFLVDADIICYLDEDNWFEPCHIEKLVKKIEEGNDWAYSLRKIYDKDGNYICDDNCESLGKWPVYFNDSVFHIDTSCFAVRRDIAVRVGHSWYGQWGADRQFFSAISKAFPKFDCTNSHTACYRLDGNPNSVNKEFFDQGNEVNEKKYFGQFPWKLGKKLVTIAKQPTQEFEVGPGIKILV